MQEIDERIGKGCFLFVDGLEHISTHHNWVVIKQRHKEIDSCSAHGWIRMFDGKCNDGEKAMIDEVREEIGARGSLQILRNSSALVKELHGIILALQICVPRVENREEFFQEGSIRLNVIHYLHLIEENQRVEDRKCWVIQYSSQHHIFQIL